MPDNWHTVRCAECSNTKDFPVPRDSWLCGDCIDGNTSTEED